jgi:hypothetical protein
MFSVHHAQSVNDVAAVSCVQRARLTVEKHSAFAPVDAFGVDLCHACVWRTGDVLHFRLSLSGARGGPQPRWMREVDPAQSSQ